MKIKTRKGVSEVSFTQLRLSRSWKLYEISTCQIANQMSCVRFNYIESNDFIRGQFYNFGQYLFLGHEPQDPVTVHSDIFIIASSGDRFVWSKTDTIWCAACRPSPEQDAVLKASYDWMLDTTYTAHTQAVILTNWWILLDISMISDFEWLLLLIWQ